jgi:phosphinothricin acetyltransferase
MNYNLECMTEEHRVPVIDILNTYIENSFAAYPEAKMRYDFYDRLLEITKGYPALVAKSEEGEVVGFAFLHPFHFANTFRRTAEITYFILPQHTRRGLGKTALDRLAEAAKEPGVDRLLASISSLNQESLRFHRKHGFQECGRFPEVGTRFGENFDVVRMVRRI